MKEGNETLVTVDCFEFRDKFLPVFIRAVAADVYGLVHVDFLPGLPFYFKVEDAADFLIFLDRFYPLDYFSLDLHLDAQNMVVSWDNPRIR